MCIRDSPLSNTFSAFGPKPSVLGRGNLFTSLLLVFPLLLVYEVGLLVSPAAFNGVDFVTRKLAAVAGHDRTWFLLINLALATLFTFLVIRWRVPHTPLAAFGSMFAESAVCG